MEKINIQSPDPDERDWEYDGDGTRIYKISAGYGTKTPYDDEKEIKKKPYRGVENPYYVDLPQEITCKVKKELVNPAVTAVTVIVHLVKNALMAHV